VVEARFSAPIQNDLGAHSVSYTVGTESFPGVKRPWCDDYHPPSSRGEVEEIVKLDLLPPPLWVFVACFGTNFTFRLLKYQISLTSLQWKPSCFLQKDGLTDRQTDIAILIVVFRNVANDPKMIKC